MVVDRDLPRLGTVDHKDLNSKIKLKHKKDLHILVHVYSLCTQLGQKRILILASEAIFFCLSVHEVLFPSCFFFKVIAWPCNCNRCTV